MASFYNTGNSGGGYGNSGTYNSNNSGGNNNVNDNQSMMYGQSSQEFSQTQDYSSNLSQWQAPSTTQQQQSQPLGASFLGSMQQQGTQAATQLFAEYASGSLTGEKIGEKLVENFGKGFGGGIPGLEYIMRSLRSYFAVDNRYVKQKMSKVLFPFWNKTWQRTLDYGTTTEANSAFSLPTSDVNAPDLYLPSMSLITYCLLCALCYGTAGQFNPEVIADVTTKCFVTQIVEVLVIRFGLYMMETPMAFLDLFSYTGYKYLGLTVNILFGMLLGMLSNTYYGRMGFYITFLWTASAAFYFMLKTMANNIPVETSSQGPKRELMVLAFAASQAVSMWLVSQTKFL